MRIQPFLDTTPPWYPVRTWIPLAKVTGSLHLWLPQYSLNLNTSWRNFDHRYRCDFDSNFDSAILRPQSRTPTTSTLNDNWYHSLSLWLRPVSWLTVIMEGRLLKNPWNMGFPILEKPLLNLERLVFRWQVKLEFNHLETDRPLALVIWDSTNSNIWF